MVIKKSVGDLTFEIAKTNRNDILKNFFIVLKQVL